MTTSFPQQVDFNMTDFTRNTTLRPSSSVNQHNAIKSYFILGEGTVCEIQKRRSVLLSQFSDTQTWWQL